MTGPECSGELPGDVGRAVVEVLMVLRARAVTRRWNERFQSAQVPVEWAEEAAAAFEAAYVLGATPRGLDAQRRGMEFADKLPTGLVEAIFGGKDLPDGGD